MRRRVPRSEIVLLVVELRRQVRLRLKRGPGGGSYGSAGAEPPRPSGEEPSSARPEPPRASAKGGSAPRAPAGRWRARFSRELDRISEREGRGPAPVVVESHQVPNVGASADLVVVNPKWMDRVSSEICGGRVLCERDLVQGIAGHEWGHVIEAREGAVRTASDHELELEADRTAGRVLAEGQGSVAPLLELLRGEASAATPTHPAGEDRVESVLAGYEEAGSCRGEGSCSCEDCSS